MNGINEAFYFVCDKLVDLQVFFIGTAWKIGRTVLLVSLIMAAINYAINGSGFKENIVKIGKATVFFFVIMFFYPRIVSFITTWTFQQARASTGYSIEEYLRSSQNAISDEITNSDGKYKGTAGKKIMQSKEISDDGDPARYFDEILQTREYRDMKYTSVAPAAVLRVVLLIASECMRYGIEAPKIAPLNIPDFAALLTGFLCAVFVIFTGVFAVLEYLMAFMEFMIVSSVGIILFPLSIWEGSKFMSEKFIGAMVGFFVKLLFCNIATFLMLYGFMTLARQFTSVPFTGLPDELIRVVFTCLLFFYICKSAPALAQSLLTGTPNLSATGAISAVAGGVATAGAAMGLMGKVGGAVAGGVAKTAFGMGGMLTEAGSAAGAVKELGGSAGDQAKAFMGSIGHSAKESIMAGGGDLTRSLLGGGGHGGHGHSGGGGGGHGTNRHNQRQNFLASTNSEGYQKSLAEYGAERKEAGTDRGLDYMAAKEQREQKRIEQEALDPQSKHFDPIKYLEKLGYEAEDIQAAKDFLSSDVI